MPENTVVLDKELVPDFFTLDNYVLKIDEINDLVNRFGTALRCAYGTKVRAYNTLLHSKIFPSVPSPQIIERVFFDKEHTLIGYQCVFFDNEVSLSDLEKEEIRSLDFVELVNSMDKAVLLRISLDWCNGTEEVPRVILHSRLMKDEELQFSKIALEIHDTSVFDCIKR